MVFFLATQHVERFWVVEIIFVVKLVIQVIAGIVSLCLVGSSHAIVEKQVCRRKEIVVWIQFQRVHKYVANPFLAGCTNVKRCAIQGIVLLVWFLSPKNAAADQPPELWSVTKLLQRMKNSCVISLVVERRTVEGIGAASDAALFPTRTISSLGIGIHIFVKWLAGRS